MRRFASFADILSIAFVWATFEWPARWALLLVIGIAWLAIIGYAIYEIRFYRGRTPNDFLVCCALVLFFLGAAFVSNVNKFYDWWREQRLKSVLKEIDAKMTTPAQHLDNLLKDHRYTHPARSVLLIHRDTAPFFTNPCICHTSKKWWGWGVFC